MALDDHYALFEVGREEALDWFREEIASLRTGRVAAALVEGTNVEHYGTRTPLNGLASISNADARTLVISPWDVGAKEAIAKALTEAELGANPSIDGDIIRLVFPSLTEEAREQTVKVLHQRAEETRVKLRQARDEALKGIKEEKEASDLTEDDFYDGKKKLDDLIDQANSEIEDLIGKKEADIRAL